MRNIIFDESLHKVYYTNMVRHALDSDDIEITSKQMVAVAHAAMGFAMPGMESDIPKREEITDAYQRTGVFRVQDIAENEILTAIEGHGKYKWNIGDRTALSKEGMVAQDQLVRFAEALRKAVDNDDPEKRDRSLLVAIARARIKSQRLWGDLAFTNTSVQ